MTREVKETITCDTCSKDISPAITGYEHEYILQVRSVDTAIHKAGQAIYSMLIYPPIENNLYFCDIKCMKGYEEKK